MDLTEYKNISQPISRIKNHKSKKYQNNWQITAPPAAAEKSRKFSALNSLIFTVGIKRRSLWRHLVFAAARYERSSPQPRPEFILSLFRRTSHVHRSLSVRGSLGSRLRREMNGKYIGYAQWPSRSAWENAGDIQLDERYRAARDRMRATLLADETLFEMDVTDDYLQIRPFD
ncbi:hypothetical protein PTR68_02945 [Serratia ureilytica]|uniref:hypothetical protein n=2 Tax=Serratia ureilytica TaxID=300181 RepID=UPI00313B1CDD